MNRPLTVATISLMCCGMNITANACSLAGCLNHGVELRQNFEVLINHADKPLAGVAVRISGNGKQFTAFTAADGRAKITDLPAGDYWLDAHFLGIGAAYECFHISDRPTRKARRKLVYEWGDEAPSTQRVAGKLIDSQPGQGGTPIWNLVHRVDVPISGASLKLQSPDRAYVYTTTSDHNGTFAFEGIPNGIYVLHIEGGNANGRGYDATDQMIELAPRAAPNMLLLTRRDAGAGSCGGTSLELQDAN